MIRINCQLEDPANPAAIICMPHAIAIRMNLVPVSLRISDLSTVSRTKYSTNVQPKRQKHQGKD